MNEEEKKEEEEREKEINLETFFIRTQSEWQVEKEFEFECWRNWMRKNFTELRVFHFDQNICLLWLWEWQAPGVCERRDDTTHSAG